MILSVISALHPVLSNTHVHLFNVRPGLAKDCSKSYSLIVTNITLSITLSLSNHYLRNEKTESSHVPRGDARMRELLGDQRARASHSTLWSLDPQRLCRRLYLRTCISHHVLFTSLDRTRQRSPVPLPRFVVPTVELTTPTFTSHTRG